MINEEQST